MTVYNSLPGNQVTYLPFEEADRSSYEHGVVKEVRGHGCFVVFNCNNDWVNYTEYTGQLCNYKDLRAGWL